MKKEIKTVGTFIFALTIFGNTLNVHAIPSAPPFESRESGSAISYSGATMITSDTSETEKSYSSTTGSQNALLVSGGTSTLNSCTVTKSGDSSGDNSDFYGTNAAILTYNGAILNIDGGEITTNGSHANAVFSYGTGAIYISNATIHTTSNNSGGVMVTGGGTLTANSCTVTTEGNSSAAIRSDRGGGTLTVNGGTYETNGVGSPAVYSTADIYVNDANLVSNASEGLVVEGANSITIQNTTVTDTNTTLNGNSETYKNVFLYQSMSGDADEGTASFTAKDSELITNKGDTVFVTNTNAEISLENTTITNSDGDFLRIQSGKWGTNGSNGGNVTLTMTNQKVEGDIIVDSISTLDITMIDGSVLIGAIDSSNDAKKVTLKMSKDSILSLTADTYVDSLEDEISDYSNIYSNGSYKLYVDGEEVSINEEVYKKSEEEIAEDTMIPSVTSKKKISNEQMYYMIGGFAFLILAAGLVCYIKMKKDNKNYE